MAFNLEQFSTTLLVDVLFFDPDNNAVGSISLIDEANRQERYLASFDPDESRYVIEVATAWEDASALEANEYAFAVEGQLHGTYTSGEDAAFELLALARKFDLSPSFLLLFEDEDG